MRPAKEALHLLMSPWFWLVLHSVICAIALALALPAKLWWTAGLAIAGTVLGAVLAVVPVWMMMSHYTNQTGYGAGNAGVLFCCSVPLFPPLGLALGMAVGYAIDRSQGREW